MIWFQLFVQEKSNRIFPSNPTIPCEVYYMKPRAENQLHALRDEWMIRKQKKPEYILLREPISNFKSAHVCGMAVCVCGCVCDVGRKNNLFTNSILYRCIGNGWKNLSSFDSRLGRKVQQTEKKEKNMFNWMVARCSRQKNSSDKSEKVYPNELFNYWKQKYFVASKLVWCCFMKTLTIFEGLIAYSTTNWIRFCFVLMCFVKELCVPVLPVRCTGINNQFIFLLVRNISMGIFVNHV